MRFEDIDATPGTVVRIEAFCAMQGICIEVPSQNKTHVVATADGHAMIENMGGKVTARHSGWCFGDPDNWSLVSRPSGSTWGGPTLADCRDDTPPLFWVDPI